MNECYVTINGVKVEMPSKDGTDIHRVYFHTGNSGLSMCLEGKANLEGSYLSDSYNVKFKSGGGCGAFSTSFNLDGLCTSNVLREMGETLIEWARMMDDNENGFARRPPYENYKGDHRYHGYDDPAHLMWSGGSHEATRCQIVSKTSKSDVPTVYEKDYSQKRRDLIMAEIAKITDRVPTESEIASMSGCVHDVTTTDELCSTISVHLGCKETPYNPGYYEEKVAVAKMYILNHDKPILDRIQEVMDAGYDVRRTMPDHIQCLVQSMTPTDVEDDFTKSVQDRVISYIENGYSFNDIPVPLRCQVTDLTDEEKSDLAQIILKLG